jgi:hypothetical protein
MKSVGLLLIILLHCFLLNAQKGGSAKAIADEGKRLYKCEMASGFGTSALQERYPGKIKEIGGYFSYPERSKMKCIVYSIDAIPDALATVTLDSSFDIKTADVNITRRPLTAYEKILCSMRKAAFDKINFDTSFKTPDNAALILIPLIEGKAKKVYAITEVGPDFPEQIIFGNDYLFTFNDSNKIQSLRPLHKSITAIPCCKNGDGGSRLTATTHAHPAGTSDLITPTDICTMLLYQKFTGWQKHVVVGQKNVSIWNCTNNTLEIISKDAYARRIKPVKKAAKSL